MTPTALIIDDDDAIRDALLWLFKSRGIPAKAWPSGEAFLSEACEVLTGCIILDIRMEGMSGLELFSILKAKNCDLPVIFLTGHGDVPMAVAALKQGAFDFIEKPFNDNDLVNLTLQALEKHSALRALISSQASIAALLKRLSPREREVMDRILAGKLNKVIADELQIAMRTVEVHRARIFEKMGVKSAVELAQLLSSPDSGLPI